MTFEMIVVINNAFMLFIGYVGVPHGRKSWRQKIRRRRKVKRGQKVPEEGPLRLKHGGRHQNSTTR